MQTVVEVVNMGTISLKGNWEVKQYTFDDLMNDLEKENKRIIKNQKILARRLQAMNKRTVGRRKYQY